MWCDFNRSGMAILSLSSLMLVSACAVVPSGSTVQAMPGRGKSLEAFAADTAACKTYAASQVQGQAEASNQRAAGAVAIGTLLGAGLGAATGGLGGYAGSGAGFGAATGLTAGTAIGASQSANDQNMIQMQYDNAYAGCMVAKGDIVPGFSPPVAVASYGGGAQPDPLVRATQAELIRTGYLKGAADGFPGPRTRSAIVAFEQSSGLPPSGTSSPRLLAKLQGTASDAAGSAATATASAPAWVAPTGSQPASAKVIPAAATASSPAPGGWVAPVTTH